VSLINILVGAALLLFGRRLFWLFVAGIGFVVGMMLATEWLGSNAGLLNFLIALGVGVLSALLSVFLQRMAFALAGFLSGGYLVYTLALGSRYESMAWIGFLAGGVLGALLLLAMFDWALIGLSALTRATVITQNVPLDPSNSALLFFVLLVFGVIAQARQLRRVPPAPRKG